MSPRNIFGICLLLGPGGIRCDTTTLTTPYVKRPTYALATPRLILSVFILILMPNVWGQGAVLLDEVQVSADASEGDTSPGEGSSRATLSGGRLKEANINNLSEASLLLPGLYSFGTSPRITGFSIRGLGNNQFNDGLDSSVGLYVDGVYLARQTYGAFGLFDLDDVTVLRGPQGAQYGMDSTAGEIHIRTRLPSHAQSQSLGLSVGNLGYTRIDTSITGSLVPGELAGRLSLYGQVRDGILYNQFDGSLLNNQNRLGVRGQLFWTPRADLSVRLIGEFGELDQKCCSIALLGPVSASIAASDAYMGYERTGTRVSERVTKNNVPTYNKTTREALSMIAEWGPIGRHRFVSISAINQTGFGPSINDDGTSMNLLQGSTTSKSRQLSQELRWQTSFKRAETTAGLIYLNQNLKGQEIGILGDEIALWALGGSLRQQVPTLNRQNSGFLINAVLPPEALNGLVLSTPYSQKSDTFSLFTSLDLKTSPDGLVTTGVRYTTSRREAQVSRSRSGGNLNSSPLALTNQLNALGNALGQDAGAVTYDGLIDSLAGESFERTDARQDEGYGGRVMYRHRISRSLSTSISLARGYKSGGLNLTGLSQTVSAQFMPETATNLELVLQSSQWLGKGSASMSVYQTKVKNFQALTYDEGGGLIDNPRQNNVLNIPEVKLQGVELDVRYPLTQRTQLGAGLAYNRAISTVFPNAPNEDTNRADKNLSGKQLYNAPRWSGFVGLERRFSVEKGREAYVAGEHTFRTKTFGAVDQSRSSFIDGYQLTNLRIGLRDAKAKWNVQAWIKNVFDEDYLQGVAALYGLGDYAGFAGEPRTYGLGLEMTLDR